MYECLFAPDKIHIPYFKTFYKGKTTQRYIKYMNQVRQLKGVTLEQLIVKEMQRNANSMAFQFS
jgi:hypothetical protein